MERIAAVDGQVCVVSGLKPDHAESSSCDGTSTTKSVTACSSCTAVAKATLTSSRRKKSVSGSVQSTVRVCSVVIFVHSST